MSAGSQWMKGPANARAVTKNGKYLFVVPKSFWKSGKSFFPQDDRQPEENRMGCFHYGFLKVATRFPIAQNDTAKFFDFS